MVSQKLPNTSRVITLSELKSHNTRSSAWVAIRGKVYDITEFISRHPGGDEVLLFAAGKDATTVFETYHSLNGAASLVLKKYCIGEIRENELPVFPEPNAFFKTVKSRVEEYFKKTGQNPKFHPMMLVRYAVVYLSLFTSFYLQFFVPFVRENSALQYLCAIILGISCAQVGLLPLHDASHAAITHNPYVWKILGASHDFLNGASFINWIYQHMLGHHPYTNVAGADPDITTGDPDVRRIKPSQRYFSHYVGQQYFVPLLYIVLGIKTRIQDVTILYFVKKNDNIRVNPLTPSQHFTFWAGKAFFVFYRFILPAMYSPVSFGKITLLFLLSDAISSYWLALLFQANHVVTNVEWPLPDSNNFVDKDWAEMQVVTAQDYAHQSWFWTNISGALNYQVVHHLFPQISQHYYPEIAPLIKQTCQEFNIPYLHKDTYWEALGTHLEHLKELGLGLKRMDSKME